MKHLNRIVAVWSVVSLLLAGCSKSGTSEPQAPQADRIVLSDGESSRDFSAEGGTWQIDFEVSADWTAEQVIPIAVQWDHFTPRQGQSRSRKRDRHRAARHYGRSPQRTAQSRAPRRGKSAPQPLTQAADDAPQVNPKGDNTNAEEVSACWESKNPEIRISISSVLRCRQDIGSAKGNRPKLLDCQAKFMNKPPATTGILTMQQPQPKG